MNRGRLRSGVRYSDEHCGNPAKSRFTFHLWYRELQALRQIDFLTHLVIEYHPDLP